MRILLIATNRHKQLMSRMNAQPLPIGLAYIAGYLDHRRHTVKMLDLMFAEEHYLEEVARTVRDFQPELVGLSLRNLSNHSYLDPQWQLPITKAVIAQIRALSTAPIVCGGPAFSLMPQACFHYVQPDLGLAGDAGEAFATLADRLAGGDFTYRDLQGVVYRDGETIHYDGMQCLSEFSRPPRLEDLDIARYNQAGFGIGVLTKLGGFYYPTSAAETQQEEGAWRVIRPIPEVIQEVKDLQRRCDLRKVFFIDNCFNVPLSHAKELCHSFMNAELKLPWNTCLAPYNCDSELIRLMKEAGCALVLMGGMRDDGSPLEERLAPLLDTCRMCEEGGLHYTIAQVFGEPGETWDTVERKLAFLRQIKPAVANLRIGISMLPGTAVAARALQEGLIQDEASLIEPTFYIAPEVREGLVEHLQHAAAGQPRWNVW
ncbi:MAG: radical SAM protein [Candidatus Tectimicrobiota bacterium]